MYTAVNRDWYLLWYDLTRSKGLVCHDRSLHHWLSPPASGLCRFFHPLQRLHPRLAPWNPCPASVGMDGQAAACVPPCFVSTGLCHVSNISLVGTISVKLHGIWDSLTFSRVSSRLAADVISFLRIAGPLHSAVFLIPIPYVIYHLCQSRNNFVFVWRFCFWDCHSPQTLEKLLWLTDKPLIVGLLGRCRYLGLFSWFYMYTYAAKRIRRLKSTRIN